MTNITITINAPELVQAIVSLANALEGKTAGIAKSAQVMEGVQEATNSANTQSVTQQAYQQPIQPANQMLSAPAPPTYIPPAQQYSAPVQAIPQQFPQQPTYQQPMQQQPTPQAAVPTAAQTYTLEQLSVAGTQLVDAGRMAELQQLLTGFGVTSLMQLPKEQYGAFATQLRAMGAKI